MGTGDGEEALAGVEEFEAGWGAGEACVGCVVFGGKEEGVEVVGLGLGDGGEMGETLSAFNGCDDFKRLLKVGIFVVVVVVVVVDGKGGRHYVFKATTRVKFLHTSHDMIDIGGVMNFGNKERVQTVTVVVVVVVVVVIIAG